MDKELLLDYDDFKVTREGDKYFCQNDNEEFEVLLLAMEPLNEDADEEAIILKYNADVTGEDIYSTDYLYFIEGRTFTINTYEAFEATGITILPDAECEILRQDSRAIHGDMLITMAEPIRDKLIDVIINGLRMADNSMNEYPGDFIEALKENYKYLWIEQYFIECVKHWRYEFFNSDEYAEKVRKEYRERYGENDN